MITDDELLKTIAFLKDIPVEDSKEAYSDDPKAIDGLRKAYLNFVDDILQVPDSDDEEIDQDRVMQYTSNHINIDYSSQYII